MTSALEAQEFPPLRIVSDEESQQQERPRLNPFSRTSRQQDLKTMQDYLAAMKKNENGETSLTLKGQKAMTLMAGLLDCFQPERFFHCADNEGTLLYRPEHPRELEQARELVKFYRGDGLKPELCLNAKEADTLTVYIFESLNPYGESKNQSRSNTKAQNCRDYLLGMPKPIAYWVAQHLLETQRSWPVLKDLIDTRSKAVQHQNGLLACTSDGKTKIDAILHYEREIKDERHRSELGLFNYQPKVRIGVYKTWDDEAEALEQQKQLQIDQKGHG